VREWGAAARSPPPAAAGSAAVASVTAATLRPASPSLHRGSRPGSAPSRHSLDAESRHPRPPPRL